MLDFAERRRDAAPAGFVRPPHPKHAAGLRAIGQLLRGQSLRGARDAGYASVP